MTLRRAVVMLALVGHAAATLTLPYTSEPGALPFPWELLWLGAPLALGFVVGAWWAVMVPVPLHLLLLAAVLDNPVEAWGNLEFFRDPLTGLGVIISANLACALTSAGVAARVFLARRR